MRTDNVRTAFLFTFVVVGLLSLAGQMAEQKLMRTLPKIQSHNAVNLVETSRGKWVATTSLTVESPDSSDELVVEMMTWVIREARKQDPHIQIESFQVTSSGKTIILSTILYR